MQIYIYSICHEVTGTIHCLGDVKKMLRIPEQNPMPPVSCYPRSTFSWLKHKFRKKLVTKINIWKSHIRSHCWVFLRIRLAGGFAPSAEGAWDQRVSEARWKCVLGFFGMIPRSCMFRYVLDVLVLHTWDNLKKYMQHEIIEKYTTYISLALADLDVLVREDATLQSSWYMSILCFASLLAASIAAISTEEGSLPEESTHLLVFHCMNARLYLYGCPKKYHLYDETAFQPMNPKYDVRLSPSNGPSQRSTIESTIAPTLQHELSCLHLG